MFITFVQNLDKLVDGGTKVMNEFTTRLMAKACFDVLSDFYDSTNTEMEYTWTNQLPPDLLHIY